MSYIVGIDEVGRGPLAGPVGVGVVVAPDSISKKFFKGIKDSKQLSEVDRVLWYGLALEARKKGELNFTVSLVSERVIDRHGIGYAIRLGVKRGLKRLSVDNSYQIFLDGSLKAPETFLHQRTIIRGDEKVPIIALASIVAKVTRDRKMRRLAKKFPQFGFEGHKGYGTRFHMLALKEYGLCEVHRRSFLKHLTKGK